MLRKHSIVTKFVVNATQKKRHTGPRSSISTLYQVITILSIAELDAQIHPLLKEHLW